LLHNDGNLRFSDVTAKAGVREGGLTLGVAWGDYDEDGAPDLYVVNDFGRNTLFHNNGNGTFSDVSMATNTIDPGYGMSSTFGDVDNDGDLDIYVSNVHSGQRWYGQAVTFHQYLLTSVKQGTIFEDFPLYNEIRQISGNDWNAFGQRVIKGNSLLLNDGKGHFTDVAEEARANPFGWYWTSAMFDYDNDGRQDLYAVNGWISGKKKDDL
jgi:FG-GAP-like repeat